LGTTSIAAKKEEERRRNRRREAGALRTLLVMQAAVVEKYGNLLESSVLQVRRGVVVPQPGDGEIQVAVRCAALNPVDWKIAEGFLKPLHSVQFPYVPGCDYAGVVSKVGRGCTRWRVGDEVIGKAGNGALAQYLVIREDCATARPQNLTWEEGAGLPLAGMTALEAVDECRAPRGGTLLVLGGSASTGSMAIQIAKGWGQRVVATCSERNVDFVRNLGADRVIDRTKEDWAVVLKPTDVKVDAVFDAVGERDAYKRSKGVLVNPHYSRFVTIAEGATEKQSVPRLGLMSLRMSWRKLRSNPPYTWLFLDEKRKIDGVRALEKVRELAQAGTLRPPIDSRFALDNITDAFARLRAGHSVGKVIVNLPEAAVPASAAETVEVEHGPSS